MHVSYDKTRPCARRSINDNLLINFNWSVIYVIVGQTPYNAGLFLAWTADGDWEGLIRLVATIE